MRRKVLQDVANTLCQMLVGWRMGEDLEQLAELPDGVIFINALKGEAKHSSAGPLKLWVAEEISAWLPSRLESLSIPIAEILEATIQASISTGRILTNKKRIVSFDFRVQSTITTKDRTYVGNLEERHEWHNRVAS